jgi:hypothetical protein
MTYSHTYLLFFTIPQPAFPAIGNPRRDSRGSCSNRASRNNSNGRNSFIDNRQHNGWHTFYTNKHIPPTNHASAHDTEIESKLPKTLHI